MLHVLLALIFLQEISYLTVDVQLVQPIALAAHLQVIVLLATLVIPVALVTFVVPVII